jgi:uncharacterized protein YciI
MGHFAIITRDGPDGTALRAEHRNAHFAHIETIMAKVALAGPLKTEAGGFSGSLVVVDAADAAEAEAILKSDPYFAAGVWQSWEIHPFLAAAGTLLGGKTW